MNKEEKIKQMITEMQTFLSSMESYDIEKKAEELVKYALRNRWYTIRWRKYGNK